MIIATIIGNLGRDAERKQAGQSTVIEFSVASTKKGKGGESTTWTRCQYWGKAGEAVAQYLSKGTRVAVSGELVMREYDKRDGGKGQSLELNVDRLQLLSAKGERSESRQAPSSGGGGSAGYDDDPGDLPFIHCRLTRDGGEPWWR